MSTTDGPSALSGASLLGLAAEVSVPSYDRAALRRSIVHIGLGGFHRAHLATYVHELCQKGHTGWGIVGSGVLPGDHAMAAALDPQDHLYCLITRGADEVQTEVIGSVVDYLHANPDSAQLVARIADSETQIVSLTVTEGGYPIDDVTALYRPDSPNAGSTGAFGIIAAGLDERRRRGGAGLTILSCDNILSNGTAARASTLGEAARFGDELRDWIEANVSFPNSMVDRITPATADSDREWLETTHGIIDRWPVTTEPFRQWVIEDDFAGDRLPLEELDVIVTDDVEPYEHMKLRLLNAAHSCLAYPAAVMGIDAVHEAMADPHIRRYVTAFLELEAKPRVPTVVGVDLDDYTTSLVERFSNPQIGDQISRLCLDGSVKFPKFLLPTVRIQLANDGGVDLAALALASWCHYLATPDDEQPNGGISPDPQFASATAHAIASMSEPAAFLAFTEVFGDDLPAEPRFARSFIDALGTIRSQGVPSAIDAAIERAEGDHEEQRS